MFIGFAFIEGNQAVQGWAAIPDTIEVSQAVSLAKMGRSGLTKQVNGDVALSLMV